MANVIYRVRDRCESICRKSHSECITNQEQADCMTDMKTYGTPGLVRMKETSPRSEEGAAGGHRSDGCEISGWVNYLQVVHLLSLSALVLDSRAVSNWTEIRYPPPSEFEGQIKIITDDGIRARLLNFSSGRIQVLSPWQIEAGDMFGFRLVADGQAGAGSRFEAESQYAVPVRGSFLCGARIIGMTHRGSRGFLGRVHEIMLDYNRRAIASA